MMDPTIVGLVVFTIIALVVIWVFRHRIKIAVKGPAGMRLEVEAESVPPYQVPNATGINQTGARVRDRGAKGPAYMAGPLEKMERAKGFEPSTPTLARLCSTPELRPRNRPPNGWLEGGG